ncbi:MAG: hypothetical protein MJK04_34885 [Psychrosphaera sp.]|nr:hypothetical protein [Psychrosphaera sp.]
MITKAELERLRSTRPSHNQELHYTIGGAIETQVHSSLEVERIGKLNRGDRRLQEALADLRHEQAFKTREGLAKAQFNQTQSPYTG